MRRRPRGLRGFSSGDAYAARALDMYRDIGSSMGDARLRNASESFAFYVFPDIDEDAFGVECSNSQVRKTISDAILGHRSDLWMQPNLPMELHGWVEAMIEDRDVFAQIVFERHEEGLPSVLAAVAPLAPETILIRRDGPHLNYEQYASLRAFEGTSIHVIGGPREQLETFSEDEIFHLSWPLDEPSKSAAPQAAARQAAGSIDRDAQRMLLNSAASAYPNEMFLSLVRARAGAFRDALNDEKTQDAIIGDRLFQPVDEGVTEYFYVDRLVRSRVAAGRVRTYLLNEFNRQLLGRWTGVNSWPEARLVTRRAFWSEAEWLELAEQYREGRATLADVNAAAEVEWESRRTRAALAETHAGPADDEH